MHGEFPTIRGKIGDYLHVPDLLREGTSYDGKIILHSCAIWQGTHLAKKAQFQKHFFPLPSRNKALIHFYQVGASLKIKVCSLQMPKLMYSISFKFVFGLISFASTRGGE